MLNERREVERGECNGDSHLERGVEPSEVGEQATELGGNCEVSAYEP